MKITTLNIDDHIRASRAGGGDKAYWTEEEFDILRQFKPKIKEGDRYLGMEHYLK